MVIVFEAKLRHSTQLANSCSVAHRMKGSLRKAKTLRNELLLLISFVLLRALSGYRFDVKFTRRESVCVLAIGGAHGVQDGRENVFIASRGINHYVVQRTGRPVGAEIMFHEKNTLTVNGIHQIFRVS